MFIAGKEIEKEEGGLVTFKDGSSELFSKEWADYLSTPEPMDDDKFRFHKVAKAVSDTMRDFKEGRFDWYEVENAVNVLRQSLERATQDAICERFGVDDPKKITFDSITGYALIHSKPQKDV